ncbi:MAG: pentapeptide repeat-containing protein [Crocosphaera sp.]|nr:pentapeptide repeat-containing protein [Crocosphaera sp.]
MGIYFAFYNANLSNANLSNANLTNANLQGVIFGGTNFYCADLTDAKNIATNQIKQQPSFWSATYNQEMENNLKLLQKKKADRESTCKQNGD